MKSLVLRLWSCYKHHQQVVRYLFFGGCTTVVNTVCYGVLYQWLGMGNAESTVIAWAAAVVFAFVTNKLFVFESRGGGLAGQVRELVSFFGCRVLTGILDVVIMVAAVDVMGWNSLLWKLLSNVLVILLNYLASKFFIFKK